MCAHRRVCAQTHTQTHVCAHRHARAIRFIAVPWRFSHPPTTPPWNRASSHRLLPPGSRALLPRGAPRGPDRHTGRDDRRGTGTVLWWYRHHDTVVISPRCRTRGVRYTIRLHATEPCALYVDVYATSCTSGCLRVQSPQAVAGDLGSDGVPRALPSRVLPANAPLSPSHSLRVCKSRTALSELQR